MMSANRKWLVTHNPLPNPRLRLFCFPYSGGAAHIYAKWPTKLPQDIEVVAIQPPGRSNRFTEPLITEMEPMVHGAVEAMREKLDRPFALFGHSLGAAIAFEACRLLEKDGYQPRVLIPSGRNAPHVKTDKKPLHQLPEDEFIAELKSYNGTPTEVIENPELMELMVPILKADFGISETYSYRQDSLLQTPVKALGGTRDTHVKEEGVFGWEQYTQGSFKAHIVDGDHFFLHGPADEFFQTLNEYLQ